MKIYNYILIIINLIFFGILFSLIKNNRIIFTFLYHKKYENIQSKNEYKIAKYIYFSKNNKYFLNKNLEINSEKKPKLEIYYDYLDNYSKFIFQESNGNLFVKINNISIGTNNIILDVDIDYKDKSILNEYNIQKSFFLTLKEIYPNIDTLYFYNQKNIFEFKHLKSFFSKNNIFEYDFKDNLEFCLNKKKIKLIPFIEKNGNLIQDIYEKAIFDKLKKNNDKIFISKNKLYSDEWINEINFLNLDLAIGITINNSNENYIHIFIPDLEDIIFGIREIYDFKSNNFLNINSLQKQIIFLIKNFSEKNKIKFNINKIDHKFLSKINTESVIIEFQLNNILLIENFINLFN